LPAAAEPGGGTAGGVGEIHFKSIFFATDGHGRNTDENFERNIRFWFCLYLCFICAHLWLDSSDLLFPVSLLKLARAQFRRHLEKPQFSAPVVFDRRAVRD
jgi:hypothetical protein